MKYTLNKDPNGSTWITEEDQFKLNSNCPASEKQGGDHPCGGSSGKGKDKQNKPPLYTGPDGKLEVSKQFSDPFTKMKNLVINPDLVQNISNTLSVVKGKKTAYIQRQGSSGTFKVTFGITGNTFQESYENKDEAEQDAKLYAKTGKLPNKKY